MIGGSVGIARVGKLLCTVYHTIHQALGGRMDRRSLAWQWRRRFEDVGYAASVDIHWTLDSRDDVPHAMGDFMYS